MFSKKKILISALAVFAILVAAFLYYSKTDLISPNLKKIIISAVPEWRIGNCLKKFDAKKTDITDKTGSDTELEYMKLNSIVAEALFNNDASRCVSLQVGDKSKSLAAVNQCQSDFQDIQAYYDFAEKLKNKTPEEDFLKYCQSSLLDRSLSFKANVPENLREQRSKMVCQSIYLSFQAKAVVFNDPFFYEESKFSGTPSCACIDASGNPGSCQSGFCNAMGFFAAVSKNDQSLCPELTDAKVFPYCNLYFDKQTMEKYNDNFKEAYCRKYSL
jgi:hypothetical protein